MDIKTRIDELSEAEAKAALFKYATIPRKRCEFCRYNNKCNYSITKNSDDCFSLIFDEVLKEAAQE